MNNYLTGIFKCFVIDIDTDQQLDRTGSGESVNEPSIRTANIKDFGDVIVLNKPRNF